MAVCGPVAPVAQLLSAVDALANDPGVALYKPDGNLRQLSNIEADAIELAIGPYRSHMTAIDSAS